MTFNRTLHASLAISLMLATGMSAAQSLAQNADSSSSSNWPQPDGTAVVLANQPNAGGTQGLISSVYASSAGNPVTLVMVDFVVPAGPGVRLSRIDADGFVTAGTPAVSASAGVEFFVCQNGAGVPGCADPNQAAGRIWRYLAPIGSTGLTIGGTDSSDPSLNLVQANQTVNLAPGTYWLGVAVRWNAADPGTGSVNGRWNWIQAGTGAFQVGAESHLISPTLFSLPTWTPFSGLGATITSRDSAVRIEAIPGPVVPPSITLNKRVQLSTGSTNTCVTTGTSVTLPFGGGAIDYCYGVTNTGGTPLITHNLVDPAFATPVLSDFAFNLAPAASVTVRATKTVTATESTGATWSACNQATNCTGATVASASVAAGTVVAGVAEVAANTFSSWSLGLMLLGIGGIGMLAFRRQG